MSTSRLGRRQRGRTAASAGAGRGPDVPDRLDGPDRADAVSLSRSLPARPARRLPSVRWWDLRLVSGVVLVLVAMVLGNRLLADRSHVVRVWQAARPLVGGAVVSSSDLAAVPVPAALAGAYLSAATGPPADRRLTHGLAPGELVPAAALVPAASLDLRRVVLTVPATGTVGLSAHRLVDIFVTPATSGNRSAAQDQTPLTASEQVLQGAVVDDVARSSALGSSSAVGVAVLVPADSVTQVLDAQARGQIVLVQRPDELVSDPR